MRRLAVVVVVVVMAVLATASAQAQANSVAATCNSGLCTPWFTGSVNLQWAIDPNPPDTQTGCANETISTEGVNHRECNVTWTTGDPPSASVPVDVKIDLTPPTLAPALARPPDSAAGWYNHPVAISLAGSTDNLSGVNFATCSTTSYSGPDSASATLSGTCSDIAGNTATPASTGAFKYDATAPVVDSAALDRPPDQNGWYNHGVGLAIAGHDDTSGPPACGGPIYSGPNGALAHAPGACVDQAGNAAPISVPLAYDDGAPEVTAQPDRRPDHDGWYNHPVTFAFKGLDEISGVASCTSASYGGPASTNATVNGSCTDVAGNTGHGAQSFKYDATRPSAANVQVTPGDHRVELTWSLPSDSTNVLVARAVQGSTEAARLVYSGSSTSLLDKKLNNGTKYVYTVADVDQAGNSTPTTVRAIPTGSSLRPFVGSVVSSPPLLTWKKIKGARYYNVQLYLGSKKVWSTWPRGPSLQLKPSWHYRGHTYTLVSGHYRWYVWPGFGALSSHNYGHRIGRSSFRVR